MRTCRKAGEGSIRSSEGVYVTVYLHIESQHSIRIHLGSFPRHVSANSIPDHLAHLDAPRLVQQQHPQRTPFLGL
jgi:hypothetical protein